LKFVIRIVGLLPKSPWRFDHPDLADVTRVKTAKTRAAASADVAVVMAWLMSACAKVSLQYYKAVVARPVTAVGTTGAYCVMCVTSSCLGSW
jgi:hypothetical protein